jgi:hypothetical protein
VPKITKPAPGTHVLTSGLGAGYVGYYLLGDNAGTVADSTANGLSGTVNGALTWGASPDATVISGTCLGGFAGGNTTTTYVDLGNSNVLNPTTAFAYEAWVYLPSNPGGSYWVIGRDDNTLGRSYAFGFDVDHTLVLQINGVGILDFAGTPATNQWIHLIATGSASDGHIYGYINAALTQTALWVAPAASTAPTCIGRRSYAGNQNGLIGTVGIASIANVLRSQSDVTSLFTNPGIVFPSGTSITTLRLIRGKQVNRNRYRRFTNTFTPIYFDMVSSSDHITPVTGLVSGSTLTVTLIKQGAATATAPAGTVSEVTSGGGTYQIAGAGLATDLNTQGPLTLYAIGTGCDPCKIEYTVI